MTDGVVIIDTPEASKLMKDFFEHIEEFRARRSISAPVMTGLLMAMVGQYHFHHDHSDDVLISMLKGHREDYNNFIKRKAN